MHGPRRSTPYCMARRAIKDMAKGNGMSANAITAELILQIHQKFPFIRCWRNNRVDTLATGKGGNLRKISAGIDGQGDICGIIGQAATNLFFGSRGLGGTMLQIETKAGKDRLSPVQKGFRAMILRHGGVYLVARNVDEVLDGLMALITPKEKHDCGTENPAL